MTILRKRILCFVGTFCVSALAGLIKSPFFLTFLDTWSMLGLLMFLFGILTYFSSRGYYDSLHFTIEKIRHSFHKSSQTQQSYAQFHQQRQNEKGKLQPVLMPIGALITIICLFVSFWIWPMI